jgi:hypothetical protein
MKIFSHCKKHGAYIMLDSNKSLNKHSYTPTPHILWGGGEVGSPIRIGITFKINSELSHFIYNLFEPLTIEARISSKTYILSTVYRSTTLHRNISHSDHLSQFTSQLVALLLATHRMRLNTYTNYHTTKLNNGVTQLFTKATRFKTDIIYSLILFYLKKH